MEPDAQAGSTSEVMLSVRIPAQLRQRLKIAAIERGKHMREIVQRAIQRELSALEPEIVS